MNKFFGLSLVLVVFVCLSIIAIIMVSKKTGIKAGEQEKAITQESRKEGSMNYPITLVHKAIVQESDWLNVARPLTADDLAGRIIVLDFWTYCCINCMQVIPDLQYLEEKFGDSLTVIGVHSAKFSNEKERDNIRSAILRYNINHPVVNDKDFVIWKSFDVHAWPTLILIDPNGKIESAYSGEGHREELARDIERIINTGKKINNSPLPIALEKNKEPETVLKFPGKLTFAQDYLGEQILFISDTNHNRILGVKLTGEIVIEIGSGTLGLRDGTLQEAQFNGPQGLLYDDMILYIADTHNHVVRKVDLKEKKVITLAGTGQRGSAQIFKNQNALDISLASPWDLAFFPERDYIVIAGAGTHQLLVYNIRNKTMSTFVGNGSESIRDGILPGNTMAQPSGLSVFGDTLYCVDSETSSLRKIDTSGIITTLIGTGLFDFGYAQGVRGHGLLQHPLGVCALEQEVYIADSYNHAIRKFILKTGELLNVSGNGSPGKTIGSSAQTEYNEPNDIIDVAGKFYIADTNNHRILVLDPKNDTVSEFKILAGKISRTLSHNLPNEVKLKDIEVIANKPIEVKLNLQENFKVNKEAPSSVALFKNGVLVRDYAPADLGKKNIQLPELELGQEYQLQGTIYYCKDVAGSVCLLESFDQKIIPRGDSTVLTIEIFIGHAA